MFLGVEVPEGLDPGDELVLLQEATPTVILGSEVLRCVVRAAMDRALRGDGTPPGEHLRDWTLEHASLAGCAAKGAHEVLASRSRR